jgi:hypothetical protein
MRILLILLFLISNSIYAQIVHVTKTGSRYHTSDCRYLWNSNYILSLREALDRYYTPCRVCEPPTKIKKKKKKLPIIINNSDDNQGGGLTRYYLNGVQVTKQEYENYNVKQNKDLVNNIFTDDFKNELKEKIRIKLQASYDSGVVDGGRLCKIKLDSLIKVIYQKNILIDSLKK